ncbi:MAG: ParB/RepB/Spo0J family partition protein [Bradymonadia bacterium]
MSRPKRGLGRGLSALIPAADEESTKAGRPLEVPIGQVGQADHQPRTAFREESLQELVDSIRTNGVIQPIIVRQADTNAYIIIAGERRWRAAQRAGLERVPIVIREATDAEAYELALVENIQRDDLGPLEEAEAYHHLIDAYDLTQEEVALRVGKNRTTVTNALRLLKLPEVIRAAVAGGHLSGGHARALLTAPDEEIMVELADRAVAEGWSVRETERQARAAKQAQKAEAAAAEPESEPEPPSLVHEAVESQLRTALRAPVRLVHRGGKGRIEIKFHSSDELNRLIEMLSTLEEE